MDQAREHLLPFVKMHGNGNDFVVVDCRKGVPAQLPQLITKIADRHFGVGADGVIALEPSRSAEFRMRYWNADGGETICGNGMRCLARFIYELGLLPGDSKSFELETLKGNVAVKLHGAGERVTVDMGVPIFEGSRIPIQKSGTFINQDLAVGGKSFRVTAVGMGNPHCVIITSDLSEIDVHGIGKLIERHSFFPEGTNVEFVEVLAGARTDLGRARMRVWERGVGETLACGSGVCAAAAALVENKKTGRRLIIESPGGESEVFWDDTNDRIYLTGPTEVVYRGEISLS